MTRKRRPRRFVVLTLSAAARRGVLACGHLRWPCAIGRSGCRALKREGDGASPRGVWPAREAFYRSDRWIRPRTALPMRPIGRNDGWCDAAGDRNYNRRVSLPYPSSSEEMWRIDGLYDLVVVLGYNDRPRVKGRGSAIFLHLARDGLTPTAGCVALRRGDAVRVVSLLRRGDSVRFG